MHPTFQYEIQDFRFGRILDESRVIPLRVCQRLSLTHYPPTDPNFHFLTVLGTLPVPSSQSSETAPGNKASPPCESDAATRLPAILRIERTAFPPSFTDGLSSGIVASTKPIGYTDIYSWMHGWLERKEDLPDVKINVIFPATEVHIRKYTKQELSMVTETPELYERIVKPYIDAFPASRTQWVSDIIEGKSEAERIVCRTLKFLILPDMKWDPSGPISSLYLLAVVRDPSIRSLRDLRGGENGHVGMLEEIRERAYEAVAERWGLGRGSLRMYVHYQPSYYHFHVHIVHASQAGMMGMTVGQAHSLDDIISMLRLSPTILSDLTFTYGLGSQHGLYDVMAAGQAELNVSGKGGSENEGKQ
ncbi:HIT-like protein [Gyrodon lividus]|nr:HIT-like protein [Gyrodon lividus]